MKQKFLTGIIVFTTLFFLGGFLVFAQTDSNTNPPPAGSNSNPVSFRFENPFSGGDSLFELLRTILDKIILPIGGIIAVLAFIYSGFLYVTAQGKEDQIKKAHKALLYTSIGTAVLLGSWLLASVICTTIRGLGGPLCPT